MESGKAYLVHCIDWHTFVGRYVRQTSPLLHLFESVSKIRDTHNGDCWEKLCVGEGREKAEYRHYTVPAELPISIVAFEWIGKTPQEEQS